MAKSKKIKNHNYYKGHVRLLRDFCNEFLKDRMPQEVFLTLASVQMVKLKLVSEKVLKKLLTIEKADGKNRKRT